MRAVLTFLSAILLLSACTGTRYGHYAYVKREKNEVVQTAKTKNEVTFVLLSQKNFKAVYNAPDNNITAPATPSVAVPEKVIPTKEAARVSPKKRVQIITPPENLDNPPARELNKSARKSLLLAIGGVFVMIVPIFGIFVGVAMWRWSVRMALDAFKEIDAEPQKYRGEGMAMASIMIISILTALTIFTFLAAISLLASETLTVIFGL